MSKTEQSLYGFDSSCKDEDGFAKFANCMMGLRTMEDPEMRPSATEILDGSKWQEYSKNPRTMPDMSKEMVKVSEAVEDESFTATLGPKRLNVT